MTQLTLLPADDLIMRAFWIEVIAENAIMDAATEAEASGAQAWADFNHAKLDRQIADQLAYGI